MIPVLLLFGAGCVVAGAAAVSWAAGLIAFGVLLLLAVVDLRQ